MAAPAANSDHAKAAPEDWATISPDVDGDTGGQFRSRQSCTGRPGDNPARRRWRHRRSISQHQYRHTKAAPSNRAAFPRPGVDGGTGGQSPSINIATPKPRRATGRRFLALASMVTPAANPDHAKAAPEGWQQSTPGVDGGTGGQSPSFKDELELIK